jgi:uncharacterized membrane protein YfcA
MKELELWGMISIFACLWLANMGGVGGGGMVVPLGIGFFKFDPKNAIALSNFSIFLSSAMRYLLNAHKPHPLKNGTGLIVDLNLAVIMLPLIISGVSFGVILNIIMPDLIIVFAFVALLSYLGRGVLKKGLGLYKKETEKVNQIDNEKIVEKTVEMQIFDTRAKGEETKEEIKEVDLKDFTKVDTTKENKDEELAKPNTQSQSPIAAAGQIQI